MSLARVAVVTGGAKGIGLAISRALSEAGVTVIAFGRDTEAIGRLSAPLRGLVCDVTDPAAVASVFLEIGPVDILVSSSPLGRLVEPSEVAAAVVYLTGDTAAAVNGQSIILDGGGIQQ